MQTIDALSQEEVARLDGLVFDLDDTVLDHGTLAEATYAALFRLRGAGFAAIACTGRPAGWGEVLLRMWPLDAAVTENGAIAWVREGARVVAVGRTPPAQHRALRVELVALAEELIRAYPAAALADDNAARLGDVSIDIGEYRRVPPEDVAAMRQIAASRGVRTFQSSVHMHLTHSAEDKASGVLWLLRERHGLDETRARQRYAFVGDSANDAVAFGAFGTTFGVANVRGHLSRISVPPRYVAKSPMGAGFVEIVERLVGLRQPAPRAR